MKRRRILMVAGEASGDALGGALAASLLRADPGLHLYGAGGAAMREAGVETIIDTAELSVMGFSELGREIVRVVGAHRRLRRELRGGGADGAPDLFIPIDFPDFNLPLCKTASRAGVPVFYYVSPQVWAWRQGRIDAIAKSVRRMLVLFPFEADIYRSHGIDAHFVGHPLAEAVAPSRPRDETRRELGIAEGRRLVALLPGSRRREIEAMLPRMLDATSGLGSVSAVIAEAPALASGLVSGIVDAWKARNPAAAAHVACRRGDTYNLLAAADAALVTSGTATLECALVGCPMVVAYRMSALSYSVARRLVRVPFIAMPNLLLGRRVVCELVQDEAEPQAMREELSRILEDAPLRERMRADFAEIRALLVRPGAADRAAALALELVA
ncbi:MAG TPA: lipid-A-disaccharide synthase [Candidatus Binatia bacterium]|jgi:lipid-A-disaccharide synthase